LSQNTLINFYGPKSTNGDQSKLLLSPAANEQLDVSMLETWLWDAACAIRGATDAPKFKDFILPLIFYKRLSDVFDDEFAQHVTEFGDEETAREIIEADHDDALKTGRKPIVRFYIPSAYRWEAIRNHPADGHLGEFVTEAMRSSKCRPSRGPRRREPLVKGGGLPRNASLRGDHWSVQQIEFVVSQTEMSVNPTVIGGLQSGWNVAVNSIEKRALPFWTGTFSSAETLSLFTAFGCLSPRLMHSAVALTTTVIWSSSPSPASLPSTVRVLPLVVWLHSTKCGLPAQAPVAARKLTKAMPARIDKIRRCMVKFLSLLGCPRLDAWSPPKIQ
jgi:hypothetical protein